MTRSKKVRAAQVEMLGDVDPAPVIERLSQDEKTRKAFETIRTVAPRLNEQASQAARDVHALNLFLRDLDIGVEAAATIHTREFLHHFSDEEDGRTCEAREWVTLEYGRPDDSGLFEIFVRTEAERCEVEQDPIQLYRYDVPWHMCSRELRLVSYAVLPKLIQDLAQVAERKANEMAKAIGNVAAKVKDAGADVI